MQELDELIELHKRYLENSMPNMIGKTVNVLVEFKTKW